MSLTVTENPSTSNLEVGNVPEEKNITHTDVVQLRPEASPCLHQKLTFGQLPTDIKSVIAQHVARPSDLKNFALTCKEMHELCVPFLYREINLDVGSPHDCNLSAFLNPRNIGLKHIRYMDVYLAEVIDKCNQIQQANFAIRMILEFLPEDILEKFSWHPWSTFSQENMVLLYKKQRKVRWREAIALDKFDGFFDQIENKMPWLEDAFKHTRKVGLYPDSRDVLRFCNFLVKKTPQLDKITLHASFDDMEPTIPARELNDSSLEPGLITSSIFSHMLPFESCTPIGLRELTLQKINLRYSGNTYCRVIDCTGLTSLRITECAGADAFFAELCRMKSLPRKLDTLEFKHDDNAEQDARNALDGFLCLVSGIRVLTIDMTSTKDLPSPASITRHHKTLRELNVHARPEGWDSEEKVYTYEEFNNICKDCTGLEQISLGFPTTTAHRGDSEGFKDFKTVLSELRSLVTINVTTWPSQSSSTRLPRQIYEHLLQNMATGLFSNPPSDSDTKMAPKLAVVAFGSSDKVYDREDSKNQIIFVKHKTIDHFGNEGFTASKIGWCQRKYVEPRSDVLDYSLNYSKAPPTSERDEL